MPVPDPAAAATGDQFFVTHCTTADSVLSSPGYGVRAASLPPTADDLRLALEYPSYELPLEMWPQRPAKANTPRRLARTHHPDSGVWVAHSVYLEKDTMGRDRCYFTHLLHLPAADPVAVLRSWDAPGWVKDYAPGATKQLSPAGLPVGTAISDDVIRTFLSSTPSGPTDVATTVCPLRLRTNPVARRKLVARFLQALVLTIDAPEDRERLYVHAEPGLVALLLYAAVRLLPPNWTADLTFSTFEPHHKGIREYMLATVVGTYFGVPDKTLGPDLTSNRGFGLDTFSPERSSAELTGPVPPGINELIDLAAAGDWDVLAEVQRWVGTEDDALAKVSKTIPVVRALRELNRGQPAIDDLLVLQSHPRGAEALGRVEEQVWPLVRSAACTNSRVRKVFASWLVKGDRLDQCRRAAVTALRKGDLTGWEAWWTVVREVGTPAAVRVQAEKCRKYISYLVDPVARCQLRAACAEAGVRLGHDLLNLTDWQELDQLLAPSIPAAWQGYVCFRVMHSGDSTWLPGSVDACRARVRRHLLTAPVAVLAAYADHAKPFLAEQPALIDDLLLPHEPECVGFMSRLINAAASRIAAADWVNLLSRRDIYGAEHKEWDGFLLRDDHLAKLLAGFKADPAATGLWAAYLDLLSAELFDGDEWELKLLAQLRKAKEALTRANIPLKAVLPEGGAAKLNAADTILAVQANPASVGQLQTGELPRAYQAFGLAPVEGLRGLYIRGGFHLLKLPAEWEKLAPFVTAFLACFPLTSEYFSARSAVTQWLAISESCDDANRAQFQWLFIRECVPDQWHQQVLDDDRRVPLLPEVEARIREGLTSGRSKRSRRQ